MYVGCEVSLELFRFLSSLAEISSSLNVGINHFDGFIIGLKSLNSSKPRCELFILNNYNGIFTVIKNLKHSRQTKVLFQFSLRNLRKNNLCVIAILKEYLQRIENLCGGHGSLFIAQLKPYKPVTANTISRWVKCVMDEAGINTNCYEVLQTS